LILALVENHISLDLGPNYQAVLESHGEKVMKAEISVGQEYVGHWNNLFSALSNPGRYALRVHLLDKAISNVGNVSPQFFDLYGRELSLTNKLKQTSGIVVRFFTPLVQNRNSNGIQWIIEILEKNQSFFSRMNPEEVLNLKDWTDKKALEEVSDEAKEPLERLKLTLEKVKLPKNVGQPLDIQQSKGI
jgi:hypothetical protein